MSFGSSVQTYCSYLTKANAKIMNTVRKRDRSLPKLTFVVFTCNYIFHLLGKLTLMANIVIYVPSLRNFYTAPWKYA